jgi:hypothetical protein
MVITRVVAQLQDVWLNMENGGGMGKCGCWKAAVPLNPEVESAGVGLQCAPTGVDN